MMGDSDLSSFKISQLDWSSHESALASTQALYDAACTKATADAQWYLNQRLGGRRAAKLLRLAAAVLAAIGLLVPMLALVETRVPAELGYVFLVASAGCLLMNNVLGLSAGWIRNVTTAFAIMSRLEHFQLQWAKSLTRLAGRNPTHDDLAELIEQITVFADAVNALVEDETRTWGARFQSDIAELERLVQAKAQAIAGGPRQSLRLDHEVRTNQPAISH